MKAVSILRFPEQRWSQRGSLKVRAAIEHLFQEAQQVVHASHFDAQLQLLYLQHPEGIVLRISSCQESAQGAEQVMTARGQ